MGFVCWVTAWLFVSMILACLVGQFIKIGGGDDS